MKSVPLLLLLFLLCSSASIAQEITVFPGLWSTEYYQDDEEITKKELNVLMAKNDAINQYWKKSKTQEVLFGVATVAEVGFLTWMYLEILNDDPFLSNRDKAINALPAFVGGLALSIAGTIFLHASNKNKKRAILQYNKQFDNKTTFRLVPVSSQNGLGLALKF